MNLDEILVAIGAFIAGDKTKAKEMATAMRAHADAQALAQELVNYGAGKKKTEMDAEVARLTRERDTAITDRDEVQAQLEELKAKAPDIAAVEARLTAQHTRKLKEKEDALAEKDRTLKGALVRGVREKLVTRLVTEHRIDADYAREVLAAKHGDRFVAKDDGTVGVLQLGTTEEIDAEGEDAAVLVLAGVIAKAVPPRYVLTSADRGGGTRTGQGGGGTGPAAEEVIDSKRRSGQYAM